MLLLVVFMVIEREFYDRSICLKEILTLLRGGPLVPHGTGGRGCLPSLLIKFLKATLPVRHKVETTFPYLREGFFVFSLFSRKKCPSAAQ